MLACVFWAFEGVKSALFALAVVAVTIRARVYEVGVRVCVGEPAGWRYYLIEICYKI